MRFLDIGSGSGLYAESMLGFISGYVPGFFSEGRMRFVLLLLEVRIHKRSFRTGSENLLLDQNEKVM